MKICVWWCPLLTCALVGGLLWHRIDRNAPAKSAPPAFPAPTLSPHPLAPSISSSQLQRAHNTLFDRYPVTYAAARDLPRDTTAPPSILDFGCASGEEAYTLATIYFPLATLHGYDLDPRILTRARQLNRNVSDRVHFYDGHHVSLGKHGPYDIIFANSVLCLYPRPVDADVAFPFSRFQQIVRDLHHVLVPGGVLVAVNTNYRVTDTNLFEPIPGHCKSFVPLMDQKGNTLQRNRSDVLSDPCLFRKVQ
jgi:SAM-dependent methyltransferase